MAGEVEFRVVLMKHVHSCDTSASTGDVFLRKEVILPFVPFPGLEIRSENFTYNAEHVTWNAEDQSFSVSTPPDKELYYAHRDGAPEPRSIETIAEEWLEAGWERWL